MNDQLILIDSSIWIEYLAERGAPIGNTVAGLLKEHRVATNDVIRMEILTGARDEKQYNDLSDRWEGLHYLPMTAPVWRRAERLRYDLRKKGHLIPVADALIASSAIAHNCALLHSDRHFNQIAKASPLKIFKPKL